MISQTHILGKDQSHLIECQNGFLLLAEVCKAFKSMQLSAAKDKIDLQIVSSYRGFDRQLQIWQNKWSGKASLLDPNENKLDAHSLTDQEKLFAILTWSALPGASRHHWGTDLDVYDKDAVLKTQHNFQLVCSEYDNGPCAALNHWLEKNAQDFGFYRPYFEYKGGIAREPWHLSFKQSADKMHELLDENILLEQLRKADILGIESIEANMPNIFQRFVLNQGIT